MALFVNQRPRSWPCRLLLCYYSSCLVAIIICATAVSSSDSEPTASSNHDDNHHLQDHHGGTRKNKKNGSSTKGAHSHNRTVPWTLPRDLSGHAPPLGGLDFVDQVEVLRKRAKDYDDDGEDGILWSDSGDPNGYVRPKGPKLKAPPTPPSDIYSKGGCTNSQLVTSLLRGNKNCETSLSSSTKKSYKKQKSYRKRGKGKKSSKKGKGKKGGMHSKRKGKGRKKFKKWKWKKRVPRKGKKGTGYTPPWEWRREKALIMALQRETEAPTVTSSSVPTSAPTISHGPTTAPSYAPTGAPVPPTPPPTTSPTQKPSPSPTLVPTMIPTRSPSSSPTGSPTAAPIRSPTAAPTEAPTPSPTASPTTVPPTPNPGCMPTIGFGQCLKTAEQLTATLPIATKGSVIGVCGGPDPIEINERLRITTAGVTFCCADAVKPCILQSTGRDMILETKGEINLIDLTFRNGSNPDGDGGNLAASGFGDPHRITRCTFEGGQSASGGNVYFSTTGAIAIRGSSFIDGSATTTGGGIAIDKAKEVSIDGTDTKNGPTVFRGNRAGTEGGAIFTTREDPSNDSGQQINIQGAVFVDNSANIGGALAISELGFLPSLTLLETEFSDNTAEDTGGAGAFLEPVEGVTVTFEGNTGSDNTAVTGDCPEFLIFDAPAGNEVCLPVNESFP